MKKILFSGYYGKKSYGDDLFIFSIHNFFSGKNNCKFNFLSQPIKGLESSNFLLRSCSILEKISKLILLNNYDYIIFAGGSTYKKYKFFSFRTLIDMYPFLNKIIFGAGIGPFYDIRSQNYFSRLFLKYKLISVRDSESNKLLSNLNLRHDNLFNGTDIVHSYIFNDFYKPELRVKNLIGISFSTSNSIENEKLYYEKIINSVNNTTDTEYNIFIFNCAKNLRDDYWAKRLSNYLAKNNINHNIFSIQEHSATYITEKINECSYMYTSRLHASIVSYSLKIPQTCFCYADKTANFLHDVGYKAALYDIIDVDNFTFHENLHDLCDDMYKYLNGFLDEH